MIFASLCLAYAEWRVQNSSARDDAPAASVGGRHGQRSTRVASAGSARPRSSSGTDEATTPPVVTPGATSASVPLPTA